MPLRVALQAAHYPNGGGAPGEAMWAYQLAHRLAPHLEAQGVDVTIVYDWYGTHAPASMREQYDLFYAIHYDAAIYGAGKNTGCLIDRYTADPVAAESDRFIELWEYRYPQATGIPNRPERRNSNTNLYYAYSSTRRTRTPAVVAEHGVGAPTGTGGYPPGQDAPYLHSHLDELAALVAGIILDFLGVAIVVPIIQPPTEPPLEEPMPILSDVQAQAAAAHLWHPFPFIPDFALPSAWLAEWRAGRWKGRPLEPEIDLPDGGKLQRFELGTGVWTPGAGVSWDA